MLKVNRFPILQNKVYNTEEEAINASFGNINIVVDKNRFISNIDFDPKKMIYDQDYDNSVPSNFFKSYYSSIIDHLIDKYKLNSNSLVLDIGCGKGTFLKQMFSSGKYNGRAIGIDPSYQGDLSPISNKLTFISEYFNESKLDLVEGVNLVILRHILEHIPNPSAFLSNIFRVLKKCNKEKIAIFIEVPDVDWIFRNKAYWDFFYEHVNYFSKESLYNTIVDSGGSVTNILNEFGGQYLWGEAELNTEKTSTKSFKKPGPTFDYSLDFNKEINRIFIKIHKSIDPDSKLVIWGMASKGIIFSLHLIKKGHEPDFFVDININKQEKFAPIIAKKIINPKELPKGLKLSIICMNPNYVNEISEQCQKLKIDYKLYTPDFNQIKI